VPFNSIDELNQAFYGDRSYKNLYMPKAKQIYDSILDQIGLRPKSILCLTRTWISEYLQESDKDVMFPNTITNNDGFDLILGFDEVLTRERNESDQKKLIQQIMQLVKPNGYLIASLRDYRNTNCHRRPLGDSIFARLNDDDVITVEVNGLDRHEKQAWRQKLHVIVNDSEFVCLDLGHRRTLYFKQMAKYCMDAGASDFSVSKDLHWSNHLRRIPEHLAFARKLT